MENQYEQEDKNITQEQQEIHENKESQALQMCLVELNEWKDRCLRSIAEFENYKKRIEKDRISWIQSTQSQMLKSIIEIVDDFDRAFAAVPQADLNEQSKQLLSGFNFIYLALKKLLTHYGVEEMSSYTIFDPAQHEALMQVESPDHKSGDIVNVLSKGYLFKGNVLRPAKVSVAK